MQIYVTVWFYVSELEAMPLFTPFTVRQKDALCATLCTLYQAGVESLAQLLALAAFVSRLYINVEQF